MTFLQKLCFNANKALQTVDMVCQSYPRLVSHYFGIYQVCYSKQLQQGIIKRNLNSNNINKIYIVITSRTVLKMCANNKIRFTENLMHV